MSKDAATIDVRQTKTGDRLEFEVTIQDRSGQTRHHVTMDKKTCQDLTSGRYPPDRCIEAAFRFLLDREPKESILARFDAHVISRYFPEFARELPRYFRE